MDWDNVGLLVGDCKKEIKRALVALDITEDVIQEAVEGGFDLIVSHHPVMNCHWTPVQTLRSDTPQGRLLRELVRQDIAAICMHTNLDAAQGGVNDVLAEKLGLTDISPLDETNVGRVGVLPAPLSLSTFLQKIKNALHPNGIRFNGRSFMIRRVAVGGGACGDMAAKAAAKGCDAFVTADVKYDQFLTASAQGLVLIDAGHFPTEDVVCPVIVAFLKKRFSDLTIQKSVSHQEMVQYYVS